MKPIDQKQSQMTAPDTANAKMTAPAASTEASAPVAPATVKLRILRPIRLKDGTMHDPSFKPQGTEYIVEVPADEVEELTRSFPGGFEFRGERYDEPAPAKFRRAERVA